MNISSTTTKTVHHNKQLASPAWEFGYLNHFRISYLKLWVEKVYNVQLASRLLLFTMILRECEGSTKSIVGNEEEERLRNGEV